MKLVHATNKRYLLIGLLAVGLGGFLSFFLLRAMLYEEVDEALVIQLKEVKTALAMGQDIPEAWPHKLERVVSLSAEAPFTSQWKDTLIYSQQEGEYQPFRQLTAYHTVDKKSHRIVLHASLIEAEDLIETLGLAMVILFGLLIGGLYIINQRILRKLWQPFFQTLDQVKDFRLNAHQQLALPSTPIAEFQQLNEALLAFSQQAQQDFNAVKSFTENASHEIQTPLATALMEIDMLVQTGGLNENQLRQIAGVSDALRRLSRLNEGLLLLAKIENRQFDLQEKLKPDLVLQESVNRYSELALAKNKVLEVQIIPPVSAFAGSPVLMGILFDNLIKNAIRYGAADKPIRIKLESVGFSISNYGAPLPEDGKWIFQRFRKANHASASLGLGLAICQEIAKVHGFQLQYAYQNGQHRFSFPIESA